MNHSASNAGEAHSTKCELALESLRTTGSLRLQVTGLSMVPSIWPKDVLVIESTQHGVFLPGDIVLYARDHRIVVHRIVSINGTEGERLVVTRGDAMPQADPPVSERDLIGKVRWIYRGGKQLQPRGLTFPKKMIGGAVQRSGLAGRVFLGIHRLRETMEFRTE